MSVFIMDDKDNDEESFKKEAIEHVMIMSCGGLLLSFVVLLCSIDQKYLGTFISTKTDNESNQEIFTENDDKQTKFSILECAEHKWRGKLGEEFMAWLNVRLAVWVEQEPDWPSDYHKSITPDWAVEERNKALLKRLRTKEVENLRSPRR